MSDDAASRAAARKSWPIRKFQLGEEPEDDIIPQVRIFLATSLDGFIAGPGDDLSWLPDPVAEGEDFGYAEHLAKIGCLLFGRRTYDVVQGMADQWSYPPTMPMLIATRRPLEGAAPQVRAVSGTIEELIAEARGAAGDKDVYLDGGDLIRQALDAGLVDHMTITLVPAVLGDGIPLFAGCRQRHSLRLESSRPLEGGMLQLIYRPANRRNPTDRAASGS